MARKRNRWTWVVFPDDAEQVFSSTGRLSGTVCCRHPYVSPLFWEVYVPPDPGKPEGDPNRFVGNYRTKAQAKRALVRWLNGGDA